MDDGTLAQEHTVKLTGYAYGGEAIGRLDDGRLAFVAFALPGEVVRIVPVENKPGFVRARLLEVVEPAPQRVAPLCVHFGVCGGCHYQHLSYPDQLLAKRLILQDQLARIARIENPPVLPAVASPSPYYYRNHVQFHLTRAGELGFHRWHSEAIFPLAECHLPEATLNAIWPQLSFDANPEPGRIGLRLGVEDDVQLVLESGSLEAPELSVEELDLSVVHLSPAGALVMAGSQQLEMEVLGRSYVVSAGSFFQVNTAMAGEMVRHILEGLALREMLSPATTLLEVYCGVGLFSAFLAPRVGQLIGVEASTAACEDFAVNLDEFDNVSLYEAPAEQVLPYLDLHPDVILLDPPRAGLDRRTLDAVLAMAPAVLIYVSCDPATLSRDVKRLAAGGYRLEQVTPFDLFPQSYHIESIAFWSRISESK